MTGPAVELAVRFDRGDFRLDVDLGWNERVVVIFGPSGSGKSTLLEVALGLHPAATCRLRLGELRWCEPLRCDAGRGL